MAKPVEVATLASAARLEARPSVAVLPFTVICTLAYPRCDFNADGMNNDRVNLPTSGADLGDPSRQQWLDLAGDVLQPIRREQQRHAIPVGSFELGCARQQLSQQQPHGQR